MKHFEGADHLARRLDRQAERRILRGLQKVVDKQCKVGTVDVCSHPS